MQRKLAVGATDDPLEREAEATARRVTRGSPVEHAGTRGGDATVRRCSCTGAAGRCDACEEKEKLQRASAGEVPFVSAPPVVDEVLRSPGRPLDTGTRGFMEPRFGYDFSRVRVHSDALAGRSAEEVRAHAYTVGEHIVFNSGRFAPGTDAGRHLLAHELTHVMQQSSVAAGVRSGRGPGWPVSDSGRGVLRRIPLPHLTDLCSGKGVTCATGDQCSTPDKDADKGAGESTARLLTINVDIEQDSWYDALLKQEFGHTYVRFTEDSGRQFTYGFYPAKELPNENKRSVPGCVHHPDTTHDRCIDDRVSFSLTKEQYEAALATAQKMCRNSPEYGQKFTCNTFAADVAAAAGQTLPSSKSEPETVFYQPVPPTDNPNTLHENIEAETKKDSKKRSGLWNSAAQPPVKLKPVGAVSLSAAPTSTTFTLNWIPLAGSTFRWRLLDADKKHYLLRGGDAAQDVLDWLSFTPTDSAIIGAKTRDLLKKNGVTKGMVECAVRQGGLPDQVTTLAVEFAP